MPKITYLNAAGEEVPSTTTIINKYKDMGGLMHYAWSEGKAGRGLTESRDRAGDVGSMLHGMIEAYIKGLDWPGGPPHPLNADDLVLATQLFDTFRGWWAKHGVEVFASETSLVSEEHQFGGTLDLVVKSPEGRVALLDWKTSKDYYQEMLLQMAAYRYLWEMGHGDVPGRAYAPRIESAALVLFSKTERKMKFYHVTAEQMDFAFQKFLLLRKTYDMEAAIAQSVKETRRAAVSYHHDS